MQFLKQLLVLLWVKAFHTIVYRLSHVCWVLKIEGQNFSYQEKDVAFKVERINLDLDFLKTLLKNKFYLNESEIYNGSVDFIGTSNNKFKFSELKVQTSKILNSKH